MNSASMLKIRNFTTSSIERSVRPSLRTSARNSGVTLKICILTRLSNGSLSNPIWATWRTNSGSILKMRALTRSSMPRSKPLAFISRMKVELILKMAALKRSSTLSLPKPAEARSSASAVVTLVIAALNKRSSESSLKSKPRLFMAQTKAGLGVKRNVPEPFPF